MLGLGDIVIPGIFVAICLKYDIDRNINKFKNNVYKLPTSLYNWCFGGYIIGILVTFAVMAYFNRP